jgi:cytidylate kinase
MENASPLVITISRQLGSGGGYIGQQLAKRLDIFYADREIISLAAQHFSMLEKDLASRDEKKLSFWQSFIRTYAAAPDAYVKPQTLPPSDHELFKTESEIILRIARERPAVIIGRCGEHILRSHPNCVSIFLHADRAFRKDRVMKLYNETEEAAGKIIARSDKERALYHRAVTGQEWTDAGRYHLSLATDKIGVDRCVEFILHYLTLRV